MQIIESTDWAVRSARISLYNARTCKTVVLFPMLHIGEPAFYQAVYDDAFSLDVVFVEGVNSPVSRRITRSYSWIKHSRRIDLMVQPPYPSKDNCRARIVQSDLPAEVFEALWRKVPAWLRACLYVVAPLMGLQRRWFGSRRQLAKGLSLEDLPSREEYLEVCEESGFLNDVLLRARDEYLLDKLHEELRALTDCPMTVGIVYGAMHMRAVLHDLTVNRGYTSVGASWMPVFSL